MNTKALRQKILDLAIHGKLVPQDPNDEPASVLLERIRAEKERLIKEGKIKRPKKTNTTSDKPHYPYELPKGWAWCKLEDFINDATDFVASGSFASLRENVKYYDEAGYAILVRTKDFQNGFTKGLVYTDRHGYEFLANSNLFGGELILPNIGASIGKVFIVPHLDIRMTLAPNSIMIKCFKDIHKKWLQYLFLSPFGQEQLRIISSSTAQGKFNKTDLRALQIPIPPFDEQERIISEVEFLSHFIEMIEYGQDKLHETIKQAKSKILDLAIHGKLVPQDPTDEPASELLKRINPKAEITCDNGHYQKLPEGWAVCQLDSIISYEQPTPYIVKSTDYDNTYTTPVLTAGKSFIIGHTNETNGIYEKLPCIIFDDFTTDSKLVDFPFKVKSSAMKILQVKEDINIEYIAMFMSITRLIGDTHKRYWISEYSKT